MRFGIVGSARLDLPIFLRTNGLFFAMASKRRASMKNQRKVNKVDSVDAKDVFFIEKKEDKLRTDSARKSRVRWLIPYVVTAIFFSSFTFGTIKYFTPPRLGLKYAVEATSGKVALTAKQLWEIVTAEGLTVYWLGPQDGARYALISVNENQNYVRYLPGGKGLNDLGPNYVVVGTYESKDAFVLTQNAAKAADSAGFINADGNSVFYHTGRPNNVYVGLKTANDQIEIFDPIPGSALQAARTSKILRKITWGGLSFITGCRVFSTCTK